MIKTHDPYPFQSQKDPRSSPTAQTREDTTPLMLFRLQECGLVEGSESQDLGNLETTVTGSVGRRGSQLMGTKVNRGMYGLTYRKNQPIRHLMPLRKPFQKQRKLYPKIKERPYLFPLMEYFQTLPFKIYHLWLNLEVHWLKGNHKLDLPINLSHPNHSYKQA